MQYIDNKSEFYKYLYQHCHCVNAGQTKEERKLKYALARHFGLDWQSAAKYRDWRTNCFAKRFGYADWQSMIKTLNLKTGGMNIDY